MRDLEDALLSIPPRAKKYPYAERHVGGPIDPTRLYTMKEAAAWLRCTLDTARSFLHAQGVLEYCPRVGIGYRILGSILLRVTGDPRFQ